MTEHQPKRRALLRRILGGWWLRPVYQALVLIAAVVCSIYLVGAAQRNGWIQTKPAAPSSESSASVAEPDTKYICPMMCTPPSSEPGRCPVCGMELVPMASESGDADSKSVSIARADRRLVGIATAIARREAIERTVRAVGVLRMDESRLARVPADAAGRVEELLVNFTGQVVSEGQPLATLYSPDLYAAQTELLTLKRTRQASSGRRYSLADVRAGLVKAARNRLVELGMSRDQIAAMEQRGEANTRITIRSPQAGTVTKMMLREGQYIKAGDILCEVADLSNIWLITDWFPEDAALIHYGHRVVASIGSLPGETLEGRVSFIDPMVDEKKQTVSVRIELENPEGQLRPGDEATVEIQVAANPKAQIYDEELAGKWICPQHPDVVQDMPGTCSRSQRPLVPTHKVGFARTRGDIEQSIVIPRSAVLMAADDAAVYVEVEEGRFELRFVTVGATVKDDIVILSGVEEGELVAMKGSFLIDSQMQLSGKPSLIDPSRAAIPPDSAEEESEFEIDLPAFDGMEMTDDVDEDNAEAEWELPPMGAPEMIEHGTMEGTP